MKKLLSKKNGFTLVEILIAFAIFAIMAAMILAIVRLAVSARNSNNEFANKLSADQGNLVKNVKETTYDSTGVVGQYELEFPDGNKVEIGYQVLPADNTASDPREGLSYFVPDVTISGDPNNPPDVKDKNGQSQSSRYDTRITGTKGFEWIHVAQVKKDTTFTESGKTRYFFEVVTNPTDVDPISMKFAQIKLYFKNNDGEYTTKNGVNYTTKRPTDAKVVDAGYVNNSSLSVSGVSKTRDANFQSLLITPLKRSGAVQIGIDYANVSYNDRGFDKGKNAGNAYFYVVFDGDPQLTTASFCPADDGYNYAFIDDKLKEQPNIYGAYLLDIKEETTDG